MVLLVLAIWLNNTSLFTTPQLGKPPLLAHRGLAQTFSMEGVDGRTNTARRIYPPEHPYLENTLASMEAAFKCGADIVEFDIRLTTDARLAVFHDDVLDYRTNGTGQTEAHTLRELQSLDIGYGYTADGGKTFPFRGKGIALMPSIEQVLDRFPTRSFLIHIKDDDTAVGEQLVKYLRGLPKERIALLSVYGGDKPVAVVKERMPQIPASSKATITHALLQYLAIGWTGYVPVSMRNTQIMLPLKYARCLWGWPYLFIDRMKTVNTRVFLVNSGGKYSAGFDDAAEVKELPRHYTGGIWTNRIDKVGPMYR